MLAKRMVSCTALVLLASCGGGDDAILSDGRDLPLSGVFTLSNQTDTNEVVFFRRGEDGTLTEAARFDTGGTGTGKSIIGSQHPLQITQDNKFLLAVSPKSDELTAFRITEEGLERTDIVGTRGQKPVSVTVRDDGLVFVLNLNGGEGGITGFRLTESGQLIPLPGSDRQLTNDPMALPPQVEFSPDGNVLVITERFAGQGGKIVTFTVSPEGQLGNAMELPSIGRTPFGMQFREDGVLVVSEAFAEAPGNPIPGEGKTSSFLVLPSGALEVISASVPAMGTVTCWVELSNDGRFVWVTNTASDNITTYSLASNGQLQRLHLTPTGKGPIGMAQSVNGKFLYVENARSSSITAFRIDQSDGSLTQFQTVPVPEPAFGMMDFKPVMTFAALDTNRDGILSAQEFNVGTQDTGSFSRFDINQDSQITEAEFNAGMQSRTRFTGFANFDTDTSGTLTQQEFAAGMLGDQEEFVRFDTDINAQLTEREFLDGLESRGDAFARFDTDVNNFLSQDEFTAGVGSTAAGAFSRFDLDVDSRISRDEFSAGRDRASGFIGLDTNLDGVLDQNELSAVPPDSILAQRDTNADGIISVAEFNAGRLQQEDEGLFEDLDGFFENLF